MNHNELLDLMFRDTHEPDRDILYLRFQLQYSFEDIADFLGTSSVKARRYCRRGIKRVMKNLLDTVPAQKMSFDEILRSEAERPSPHYPGGGEQSLTDSDEASADLLRKFSLPPIMLGFAA